jgi:hypothetical protein
MVSGIVNGFVFLSTGYQYCNGGNKKDAILHEWQYYLTQAKINLRRLFYYYTLT